MILGKYLIQGEVQDRGYSRTAITVDEQGGRYFTKWIKGVEKDSHASRNFKQKVRHLKKVQHASLPRILECDWDPEAQAYCMIYEWIKATTLSECAQNMDMVDVLKGFQSIAECLEQVLQSCKLGHGDIHPANILISETNEFFLIDFGVADLAATVSQEKNLEVFARNFAAPEKWNPAVAKGFPYHADIYSLAKSLHWTAEQQQLENVDALDDLYKTHCAEVAQERGSFTGFMQGLDGLMNSEAFVKKGIVYIELQLERYYPIISKELGQRVIVLPYDPKGPHLLFDAITDSFILHFMWIREDRRLVLKSNKEKKDDLKTYQRIARFGSPIHDAFEFQFINKGYTAENDSRFGRVLEGLQAQNSAQKSYREKFNKLVTDLGFYKELLNKELDIITSHSLKVKYHKYESEKGIWSFYIKLGTGQHSRDQEFIYNHIDLATPPNPTEFSYLITSENEKGNGIVFEGVAYNLKPQQNDEAVIRFKNCRFSDAKTKREIKQLPSKGVIKEDTTQAESEKQRQLDAIGRVERRESNNNALIEALFNPSSLEPEFLELNPPAQVFQRDGHGNPLCYSDNQNLSIFNALNRKPLSLIQGPPGTGKTTVITEIVFQILHRDPDAKILITSQTNAAVDNVLDNLVGNDISVLRLQASREPKESLAQHTIKRKIDSWKVNTGVKAENNLRNSISEYLLQVESEPDIVLRSILDLVSDAKSWEHKLNAVRKACERTPTLKAEFRELQSEDDLVVRLANMTTLKVEGFYRRIKILRKWIETLKGLTGKSSLNNKLVLSVRVIGATTNHIAAKQYQRYQFDFDYVIMDESGKATIAESLIPLVMTENAILVGDHRQLRPMLTSQREVEKWLRDKFKKESNDLDGWEDYFNRPSLFEKVIGEVDSDFTSQLAECRRSSKDQVRLTSECFYEPHGDEPIVPVPRLIEKEHNLPLKVNSSIIFLDIGEGNPSKQISTGSSRNPHSAELIALVLRKLDRYHKVGNYTIGVIAGYTAQVKAIKSAFHKHHIWKELRNIKQENIQVSVVDRFQGLECDIIIFDLVRSGQKTLGFLANYNRINVALSRQKRLLLIVGDYNGTLAAKHPDPKFEGDVALHQYLKRLKPEWRVGRLEEVFP
jgi:serine/threonine protein kinase